MDILLVFGKINSAQYNMARLKMHERGQRPRIVRFDKDEQYRDALEFDLEAERELTAEGIGRDFSRKQQLALLARRSEALKNKFIQQELAGKSLRDVKAILLPAPGDDDHLWRWLTQRIRHKITEYTLQRGETGEFYVVGPEFDA